TLAELGRRSLLCGSKESLVAIIIYPSSLPAVMMNLQEARNCKHPFASITWSRFKGSVAPPRNTLSLRPIGTGRLPVISSPTVGRTAIAVKGLRFPPVLVLERVKMPDDENRKGKAPISRIGRIFSDKLQDGFGARTDMKLLVNGADVRADGMGADGQRLGNFFVLQPFDHVAENLIFPRRK